MKTFLQVIQGTVCIIVELIWLGNKNKTDSYLSGE